MRCTGRGGDCSLCGDVKVEKLIKDIVRRHLANMGTMLLGLLGAAALLELTMPSRVPLSWWLILAMLWLLSSAVMFVFDLWRRQRKIGAWPGILCSILVPAAVAACMVAGRSG